MKTLRKLGIQQIEDIALGASLLGAGGGGDPYIGKLMAIGAVRECGEVTLISPEEVPDDALIMPIAMMGAPTVLCEKGIGGTEYKRIFEMVERYFGRKVYATMPMEAGGVNSMLPIAAAARLGLPMVDCDGMGRAFPELQMVTFTIGGVSATPMALTDEKGNSAFFDSFVTGIKTVSCFTFSFSKISGGIEVVAEGTYPVMNDLTITLNPTVTVVLRGGATKTLTCTMNVKIEADRMRGRASATLDLGTGYTDYFMTDYEATFSRTASENGMVEYAVR